MRNESQPGVYVSLARFVVREIERKVKRGPRPEEIVRDRRFKQNERIRLQNEALDAADAAGNA